METVAETDEELLEKYLENGELSDEDIYSGLIKGCSDGEIAPVLCGSATKDNWYSINAGKHYRMVSHHLNTHFSHKQLI